MSYIINKTDGSVLTEVVDGTVDQTASDITLIGKNSSSYGEFVNENFVHMLENFANTTQPSNPILGQLWYDTSEGRLKVYDGNGFKVSGGTIVASAVPSSISQGDIWIDSLRKQLYFNDGVSTVLAGPIYSEQQGISGSQTVDVADVDGNVHTVVFFYVAKTLMGIWSKDRFTPASAIAGYTGEILIGFNVGSYSGLQLHAPAASAYNLIDATGAQKTADNFLNTGNEDGFQTTTNTLVLTNTTPLILGPGGPAGNNEVNISGTLFQLNSNTSNQNFQVGVLNANGLKPGLYIDSTNEYVGLYTNAPTSTLDVNGNARIRGDLLVEGATTVVNSTNITIEDKLIELGAVPYDAENPAQVPSNSTADGGGILLQAGDDGDKEFTWAESNASWNSTESFNVALGKHYKINNFEVISSIGPSTFSLGSGVTSAPGLTSLGTQITFNAGNINISANSISATNTGGSITLVPLGSGTVGVSNKRISNLANPSDDKDAANKIYVDTKVTSFPIGLAADTTAQNGVNKNDLIASQILNKIYPVENYDSTIVCRIYCSDIGVTKQYSISAGTWVYNTDI